MLNRYLANFLKPVSLTGYPMRYADSLPEALYSADSVRAMDRYLIDQQGVDGFELMQSAARGAFRQLLRHWPSPASVLVLCGAGNNGGDGYLIALNAHKQGIPVQCVAVSPAGTRQAEQEPQCCFSKGSSTGSGALVKISPRKK